MSRFSTYRISSIGLFVAIIIVLSQISIPMPYGVPMTLQTLIIPIVGIILGKKDGTIATGLYLVLGLIGLPVFAGFSGSVMSFIGPTGGFLISFPLMAYLAGMWSESGYKVFIGLILGSIINSISGMLFFSLVTKSSLQVAFFACVAPFILTSVIKVVLSGLLGIRLKKIVTYRVKSV